MDGLKKIFTNKNVVTILGVVVILVILYFLYTKTLKEATDYQKVPVAREKIEPQTEIQDNMIETIQISRAVMPTDVIQDKSQIVGKFTGVGVSIPRGGMFYGELLVNEEDLPGHWLSRLETDALGNMQIPYYFSVNTTTTYGNTIRKDDYVDFYLRTYDEQDQLMYGVLLDNVPVLAVTDSSGKELKNNNGDNGSPAFLNFGFYKDNYLLLKYIENVSNKDLELIIVPHGTKTKEEGLKINVTPEALRDAVIKGNVVDDLEKIETIVPVNANDTTQEQTSNQN